MGLDHRKGPDSCALPKYVSDHPYWGQIGLGWSVQESMTYILIIDLLLRLGHRSVPKSFRRGLNKKNGIKKW